MGRKIFQNGVWYHMEKKIKYDTEYMARELIELCPQAPVELLQELRWLYRPVSYTHLTLPTIA